MSQPKKSKWRINWWFFDLVEGVRRGHDIVEAPSDFDEEDALDLLDNEMWNENTFYQPKTKNFSQNSFSSVPGKWGVLSVKKLDEV